MKILVVEDEPKLAEYLRRALTESNYIVDVAHSGTDGRYLATEGHYDLVLLDVMLPGLDGYAVLQELRRGKHVPVLMLTARDEVEDRVRGLQAGADDYLVKPFGGEQLAARIRAVLRRTQPATAAAGTRVGELEIDPAARRVTLAGAPIELSRKEFDLLWLLASRAGEVVTKRELLAEVWGLPLGGGDRTVDVHVSWLRRKLGETAAAPRYLETVRGVGLRLVAPSGDA